MPTERAACNAGAMWVATWGTMWVRRALGPGVAPVKNGTNLYIIKLLRWRREADRADGSPLAPVFHLCPTPRVQLSDRTWACVGFGPLREAPTQSAGNTAGQHGQRLGGEQLSERPSQSAPGDFFADVLASR